jgi:hypothetical protein
MPQDLPVVEKRKVTKGRKFDARPDTLDFRDRMYEATLVEVPTFRGLDEYRKWEVPILDQGVEGACTGFGLATVANYLLRRRRVVEDKTPVSARMLYDMARRYDEWPGVAYDGSSARGAMKGWHNHGVCSLDLWPNTPDEKLTNERAGDATRRPLGAYFRVNHKDIVAMHSAIAEVGCLFATSKVHTGWQQPGPGGVIEEQDEELGGHAFAIVAYEHRGFWIQNSWGPDWGLEGFGLVSYDDWLNNGSDIWVARLGAPVDLRSARAVAAVSNQLAGESQVFSFPDLRPHVISLGNNGRLRPSGTFGTKEADVEEILQKDFPRITQNWKTKRLAIYAHGGLVPESSALDRIAGYRPPLLAREVYPLGFIWHTDIWSSLHDVLADAVNKRRPEGFLDASKDFLLDRLDDALEPVARKAGGRALWNEMKQNAMGATENADGGARIAARLIGPLAKGGVELHLVGHSAGSVFLGPLVELLTGKGRLNDLGGAAGLGLKISSLTLWAPACSMDFFRRYYLPAITSGAIESFTLFTLTDGAEQDDSCANIYHKSLLYLVSNAFEDRQRIPLLQEEGTPLLGMEKFVNKDKELLKLLKSPKAAWIKAPNQLQTGSQNASHARHHGDFDDDRATLEATLARVLGKSSAGGTAIEVGLTASSLKARRQSLSPIATPVG